MKAFAMIVLGAITCVPVFAAGPDKPFEFPIPADAYKMKPGLWEETRRSSIDSPPIKIDTSQFDPATRARVEATLKRQADARAARGGAPESNVRTQKTCRTKSWLADQDKKDGKGRDFGSCPPVVKSNSASRTVFTLQCTQEIPLGRGDGPKTTQKVSIDAEWIFEVKSPEEGTMQMTSTTAMAGEPPRKSVETVTARWLGPDCGNVKPR
jgi:hypothetical protein